MYVDSRKITKRLCVPRHIHCILLKAGKHILYVGIVSIWCVSSKQNHTEAEGDL